MASQAPPNARQVAAAFLQDHHDRSRLIAFARTRFGIPAEDAEDLIQDTALELLRRGDHLRNPEAFVFTVFRARCSRFLAFRCKTPAPVPLESTERCEALLRDAGAERLNRELALRQALNGISSICRRILAAYYVEGQSLKEAARAVAQASSGVSKTISRCLQRLRKCLS